MRPARSPLRLPLQMTSALALLAAASAQSARTYEEPVAENGFAPGGNCSDFDPCLGKQFCMYGKCWPCHPGQYAGRYQCLDCPSGSFILPNETSCTRCPAGTWSLGGGTECLDCPESTFAWQEGSGVCRDCPAGTWAPTRSTSCRPCPPGTYSQGPFRVDRGKGCEPCPSGTYSGEEAGMCLDCEAGTWATPGSAACSPCPPGTYSPGSSRADSYPACKPCPPGTFSEERASSCAPCIGDQSACSDNVDPARPQAAAHQQLIPADMPLWQVYLLALANVWVSVAILVSFCLFRYMKDRSAADTEALLEGEKGTACGGSDAKV